MKRKVLVHHHRTGNRYWISRERAAQRLRTMRRYLSAKYEWSADVRMYEALGVTVALHA